MTWYWGPESWSWNPAEGRWRPEHGLPRTSAYLQVTTKGVKRSRAYDYWCDTVYYNFDPDRSPSQRSSDFHAEAQALITPRGSFYVYESASISGRRTHRQARSDSGESIDIGLVVTGLRHYETDRSQALTAASGEFFVYDPTRPARVGWKRHRGIHLTVHRQAVEAALGGALPPSHLIAKSLSASRLASFLRAQLITLAQHLHTLTPAERVYMLDHTIDLGITAMRSLALDSFDSLDSLAAREDDAQVRRGILLSARQYIAAHIANPALSTTEIAAAIGCSRTTLYRAFADMGIAVSDYIREQRLQRFLKLLQQSSPHQTITELALKCGFADVTNFNKIFRRRFGMSPSEVRRAGILV